MSPVWLQVKRKPGGAFVIRGGHDIDKGNDNLLSSHIQFGPLYIYNLKPMILCMQFLGDNPNFRNFRRSGNPQKYQNLLYLL